MKQNLTVFILTVVLCVNVTGCSVVRFAETRMGYGVSESNRTVVKDFHLGFNVTQSTLSVRLNYDPYAISKPRITLLDFGVGMASLGILGKVLYDNWDHDYTPTFVDDTFDWYGSEPWEKAVMIGVPVDILLYWAFAYPFDRKAVKLEKEPLINHPYRIELPDHGNIGRNYQTTTGIERIEVAEFLSELGNPTFLQNVESLRFRASAEFDGKKQAKDYTTPISPRPSPRPYRTQVEIEAQWIENYLRAGEKAALKVRVKNSTKTVLTEFSTITSSDNPRFDNWKLKFGDIAPETSETRTLGFSTDEMSPQDVFVHLRFETANNFTHSEIEKVLHIIE